MRPETPSGSPCQLINSESRFKSKFSDYAEGRIRRAMRRGFIHIDGNNQQGLTNLGMTALEFVHGDGAARIDGFRPDYGMAIEANHILASDKVNRCPGDAKVSWKWQSAWRHANGPARQKEFKKVLAQINFYMKQHKTRYGYILTDTELVPIQRLNNNGHLEFAPSIPWSASNIFEPGDPGYNANQVRYRQTLTPLLALWYLAMLAAVDLVYHLP
jgi:hypothetical protein